MVHNILVCQVSWALREMVTFGKTSNLHSKSVSEYGPAWKSYKKVFDYQSPATAVNLAYSPHFTCIVSHVELRLESRNRYENVFWQKCDSKNFWPAQLLFISHICYGSMDICKHCAEMCRTVLNKATYRLLMKSHLSVKTSKFAEMILTYLTTLPNCICFCREMCQMYRNLSVDLVSGIFLDCLTQIWTRLYLNHTLPRNSYLVQKCSWINSAWTYYH